MREYFLHLTFSSSPPPLHHQIFWTSSIFYRIFCIFDYLVSVPRKKILVLGSESLLNTKILFILETFFLLRHEKYEQSKRKKTFSLFFFYKITMYKTLCIITVSKSNYLLYNIIYIYMYIYCRFSEYQWIELESGIRRRKSVGICFI